MKKKLSNVFILFGVVFIVLAAFMLREYIIIEETAKESSQNALTIIYEEIDDLEEDDIKDDNIIEINSDDAQTEILIDGNSYIAVLSMPTINIELPIQSSWSYEKLKSSPCIYQSEPLSIAGHNYTAHFGKIGNLEIGDTVTLTYITGEIEVYQVVSVTKISEIEVEEVNDNSYDLTLFTCNYSDNTERILVRFKRV